MDDSPADILVSHADMAMYRSKQKRAGSINFYDEAMDREVKARHAIKKFLIDKNVVKGPFSGNDQEIYLGAGE